MTEERKNSSYAEMGTAVDMSEALRRIRPLAESTEIAGVLGSIGGFGGLFEPAFSHMNRPVLISGADGVGTKLKLAFALDKHDTVGIDCVAMCVNDIICQGADPLFFLDYLALGENDPGKAEKIVSGIATGCREAGCALIGGDTAKMPGSCPPNEYDLAGFAVGIVEHDRIIDGHNIKAGDRLIGLASSGLHLDGFSLALKILGTDEKNLSEHISGMSCSLGEALLRPTRIYVKPIQHLIKTRGFEIKGIANITGGGFIENIPRILPDGVRAVIKPSTFPEQPVFSLLSERGNISTEDMYHTFNMGIGMILVVDKEDAGSVMYELVRAGETPYVIGCCIDGEKGVEFRW